MGEYGIYVWPCYFLAFLLLGAHALSAVLEWHRLTRKFDGKK